MSCAACITVAPHSCLACIFRCTGRWFDAARARAKHIQLIDWLACELAPSCFADSACCNECTGWHKFSAMGRVHEAWRMQDKCYSRRSSPPFAGALLGARRKGKGCEPKAALPGSPSERAELTPGTLQDTADGYVARADRTLDGRLASWALAQQCSSTHNTTAAPGLALRGLAHFSPQCWLQDSSDRSQKLLLKG